MNFLYLLNYFILSIFLTLFGLEVGIALLFLLPFKKYYIILQKYLAPIWEVEGTFAVFYVVNLIATYPLAVPVIGALYVFPALIGGLFLIARNAFLAYSEYADWHKDVHLKIYSLATIIIAFILTAIVGSAISGNGVNLKIFMPMFMTMFLNPFNLVLFASIALLGIAAASIIFSITELKYASAIFIAIAIIGMLYVISIYMHYAIMNLLSAPSILIAMIIFLLVVISLHIANNKISGILFAAWLVSAINLFGVIAYPYFFGGNINITDFLTNSASANAILNITIIGGTVLTLSLLYLIYASYIKKENK